jgi:hypothetical protein
MAGRKNYQVRLACPIHGEDVKQTLTNATYTEAKEYTAKCPHCPEGNQSCVVIESVDLDTGKVVWTGRI